VDIFEELNIDPRQDITLAHQLKQQITWLIANGKLKPGDQLPPVQVMAERLGINLNTARSAYLKLATEGLVETRQGRGTHVLPFDLGRMAQVAGATRSHTIGVIVPTWTNPFYHALLQGIEEIASNNQTLLFLCNTHDDPTNAWRDFAMLAAKQVDGILVVSHDIGQVMQPAAQTNNAVNELPYVTIDWPGSAGYAVLIDLQMAGYQATRHLIEHGHRRIGLITVASDAENVTPINRGYEQALAESDIRIDPALIARVPGFDIAPGAEGARKLLALPDPPAAMFAIADMLALGAMQAIKQAGVRIPGDIALVGFNDIPAAALVEPALTSVAAPAVQLGREGMRMLQLLMAGERPPQRQKTLSTSLIVRESCGCPRKEG
jgi:DNA-binding LacI/PurR family transcriptional regulator